MYNNIKFQFSNFYLFINYCHLMISVLVCGKINWASSTTYWYITFDNPLESPTRQTLTTLSPYSLIQVINKPAHRCGHIIDWVIVRPTMTSIKNLLLLTHLNQTIIALNPLSMFQSLTLLPCTALLGTLLTLTAHHLLLSIPFFQSFYLLKRQTSSVTFCALY